MAEEEEPAPEIVEEAGQEEPAPEIVEEAGQEEPTEAVDETGDAVVTDDAEHSEVAKEDQPQSYEYEDANERIFLLEFIVDQVSINFCGSKALKCIQGQTCVSFEFLDNGPFNVCEADFTQRKNYTQGCTGSGSIKNGKSCLFSLTQAAIDELKNNIIIKVKAFKSNFNGTDNPGKVIIGQTQIPISSLFAALMSSVTEEKPVVTKTTKDCYRLQSTITNDIIGHLTAYIRLSCFGKTIINNFQMNTCDQSVNIRTTPGYYTYKYTNTPASLDDSNTIYPPCWPEKPPESECGCSQPPCSPTPTCPSPACPPPPRCSPPACRPPPKCPPPACRPPPKCPPPACRPPPKCPPSACRPPPKCPKPACRPPQKCSKPACRPPR